MGYYWQVATIVYKYAAMKNNNQNQKDKWLYKIKYQIRKKID